MMTLDRSTEIGIVTRLGYLYCPECAGDRRGNPVCACDGDTAVEKCDGCGVPCIAGWYSWHKKKTEMAHKDAGAPPAWDELTGTWQEVTRIMTSEGDDWALSFLPVRPLA